MIGVATAMLASEVGPAWRRGSIRLQLTLIASAVVAVVLMSAAVVLVAVQRDQLESSLDQSLIQRADALGGVVGARDRSDVIANNDADDRAAQLVGANGSILASSTNLDGESSLADAVPRDATQVLRTHRDVPLEDSEYRVLTRRVETDQGPGFLVVIETAEDVTESVGRLAAALALATPGVLVSLATVMWFVLGKALGPVEAIRAEVAEITGSDLRRRVPVPPRDDEIGRLARTMNDMLHRIERAHERQRRFVADASHELRTPLTRIRTQVEVDLNHPDGADPVITNQLVLEETSALQRMIEDLLHLARSDAGIAPSRREPVDLDRLVRDEVRRLRSGAMAESHVRIDTTAVHPGLVSGDPDQLSRAVRNLLVNAARFANTAVAVHLFERDGRVVLEISDDGPGVPPADRSKIFERFSRVDDARTRDDGGTGLGLAIVKDVVERHGGTVACADGPMGGATFRVELPASDG